MLRGVIFNSRERIWQPSTLGRRCLIAVAMALMMGAYATQAVIPAAESSPASIAGIAPSGRFVSRRASPPDAGIT